MDSITNIVKKLRENRLNEAKHNYGELDHDILIGLAQEGDQKAFEELLRQYDPIIKKQSRKYFLDNGNGDQEDIQQIASLAFWDAVKSYNPDVHKHGFGAFANLIISRKLTDLLRKEDADVRKLNNFSSSLDDKIRNDDDGDSGSVGDNVSSKELSPEEAYLGNAGAKELKKFMRDNFSQTERDVILRYIRGYKVSEIAEETGMKYKSVENALMRVKNKLTDFLKTRESKKIRERNGSSIEFTDAEKQILMSVITKIEEGEDIEAESEDADSKQRTSNFHALQSSYPNHMTFKDKDKESGNIRDVIEDFSNKGIEYEIYNHLKDNGCTIFYESERALV